jgi:ribonuclease P protein component
LKKYSFGKNERLHGKKNISRLFADGKYFFWGHLQVVAIRSKNQNSKAEFGISVPKRNIKKAVDRNLIKRRLKESIRLQKKPLEEHMKNSNYTLQVFIVWQSTKIPESELCFSEIKTVIHRLSSKIDSLPLK